MKNSVSLSLNLNTPLHLFLSILYRRSLVGNRLYTVGFQGIAKNNETFYLCWNK